METKSETIARWKLEDAAAVTKREQRIIAKKRRNETKPDNTTVEWWIVSRYKGRPVYYAGGTCGTLWTSTRSRSWGERDVKRLAGARRDNLQNWIDRQGPGPAEQVEVVTPRKGTRIESVTDVTAREMFNHMTLERVEVNRWNITREGWQLLAGWNNEP